MQATDRAFPSTPAAAVSPPASDVLLHVPDTTTVRAVALAGAYGTGASVLTFFASSTGSWRRLDALALGLSIAAALAACVCTFYALRAAFRDPRKTMWTLAWRSMLPPVVLFAWTLVGILPALLAGLIAALALAPLVHAVQLRPAEHRSYASLWLALVALVNALSPWGIVVVLVAAAHALAHRATSAAISRGAAIRAAVAFGIGLLALVIVVVRGIALYR